MADASARPQSTLRTALAGLIGNVLEWFDFAVYGYFASNIGHQFFPKGDPAVQHLSTYATFALGFFARPIGSLVLGSVDEASGQPFRASRSLVTRLCEGRFSSSGTSRRSGSCRRAVPPD